MISDHSSSQLPFWSLVYLIAMVLMGWLSCEEFRHILAATDEAVLLVYDKHGRSHLLLPDHLSDRPQPPPKYAPFSDRKLFELDFTLLKPSCCEAPMGLSHYWGLPRRLGEALGAHAPRPALSAHPGSA
jgi:hypothetical protein